MPTVASKKTFDKQDEVLDNHIKNWRTNKTPETALVILIYMTNEYGEHDATGMRGFNHFGLLMSHENNLGISEMREFKSHLLQVKK